MIELQQMMHRIADAATLGVAKATHGIVSAVDPTRHAVQVAIMPEGTVSGWLPDPGYACGDLRISCPSEVGTQVLLESVEGQSEEYVIVARLFDSVVLPGVSPQTNAPAQPGEILIMSGQGRAPKAGMQSAGQPTNPAAWMHVLKTGVYTGIGTTKLSVEADAITLTLGSTSFTFTASSLAAIAADITTDHSITADQTVTGKTGVFGGSEPVSLVTHVHTNGGGTGNSGPPA